MKQMMESGGKVSEIKSRNCKAEEIASISIDGTSGTIVPLDSGYKPLREFFRQI